MHCKVTRHLNSTALYKCNHDPGGLLYYCAGFIPINWIITKAFFMTNYCLHTSLLLIKHGLLRVLTKIVQASIYTLVLLLSYFKNFIEIVEWNLFEIYIFSASTFR